MNLPTPEEALAGMARVGSPRVPMGNDAIPNPNVVPVLRGTLVPKGHSKTQDPYVGPTNHRQNVSQETLGAAHTIAVSTPPMTDPSAGATQANGHIIPSATTRSESFVDGGNGAYVGY